LIACRQNRPDAPFAPALAYLAADPLFGVPLDSHHAHDLLWLVLVDTPIEPAALLPAQTGDQRSQDADMFS